MSPFPTATCKIYTLAATLSSDAPTTDKRHHDDGKTTKPYRAWAGLINALTTFGHRDGDHNSYDK